MDRFDSSHTQETNPLRIDVQFLPKSWTDLVAPSPIVRTLDDVEPLTEPETQVDDETETAKPDFIDTNTSTSESIWPSFVANRSILRNDLEDTPRLTVAPSEDPINSDFYDRIERTPKIVPKITTPRFIRTSNIAEDPGDPSKKTKNSHGMERRSKVAIASLIGSYFITFGIERFLS